MGFHGDYRHVGIHVKEGKKGVKSGKEERIGGDHTEGLVAFLSYLRYPHTLCTMPRKALILSALSTLAMTFPTPPWT